jgi:hypothetical protein
MRRQHGGRTRYRVWIVRYDGDPPKTWDDAPAGAVTLEPAEQQTMGAGRAACYVEAFNRAALAAKRDVWAVAVPIKLRYVGDPLPGERLGPLAPPAHKKSPLHASQVSACNGLPPRGLT